MGSRRHFGGYKAKRHFFYRERIIEYCIPSDDGPLASLTVKQFVESVGARTPAPVSQLSASVLSYFLESIIVFPISCSYQQCEHEKCIYFLERISSLFQNALCYDSLINYIVDDTILPEYGDTGNVMYVMLGERAAITRFLYCLIIF